MKATGRWEASISRRSACGTIGRSSPLRRRIFASLSTPTSSTSPHSFARARYLTWPRWMRSKEPDVSTIWRPRALSARTSAVTSARERMSRCSKSAVELGSGTMAMGVGVSGGRGQTLLLPPRRTRPPTLQCPQRPPRARDSHRRTRETMPDYLPFPDRTPGTQYRDMLREIRDRGIRVRSKQGPDALAIAGCVMRFDIAHGAAVIAERSIRGFVRKAIGELCAFINGARTLDELAAFGCDWWGAWATEEKCVSRGLEPGDLGPGSYGHAFRSFTTDLDGDDPGFDQLPHLVKKLRDLPIDRTAVMSPWIPSANHREAGLKSRN